MAAPEIDLGQNLAFFALYGWKGAELGPLFGMLSGIGAVLALWLMQLSTKHASVLNRQGIFQLIQRVAFMALAIGMAVNTIVPWRDDASPWASFVFIQAAADVYLLMACFRREAGMLVEADDVMRPVGNSKRA